MRIIHEEWTIDIWQTTGFDVIGYQHIQPVVNISQSGFHDCVICGEAVREV
jgi:hypothetical protein